MSELIKIDVKDQEIKRSLKKLTEKTKNMRPIMRKISAKMHSATEENFRTEGARLGKKWQDLSPSTKKQRARIGKWPGAILQQQGSLVASISTYHDDNTAAVGTNKEYAAIHQLGGEINHPARERIMHFKSYKSGKKKGKTLFSKSGSATYGMKAPGKAYTITMPARPFLGLNDDDLNKILGIITDDLNEL